MDNIVHTEVPVSIARLSRDLRAGAATLGKDEARFLVDAYYAMQKDRIADDAQVRALGESGEPHSLLRWLGEQHATLEKQIQGALEKFALADPVGQWSMSITGIGPVIAAGLLAHIDIEKAPTAGHIWRFAGLDPTVRWGKGKKRPWNAGLKVLAWKIGESFVKTKGSATSFYGPIYEARKTLETARNEAGEYAEQAAATLTEKKFRDDTDAKKHYEAGRLPPGRIHARAKRYAVKLFLSHWHEVAWRVAYGTAPPAPYVMAHAGHVHFIPPPNWPPLVQAA